MLESNELDSSTIEDDRLSDCMVIDSHPLNNGEGQSNKNSQSVPMHSSNVINTSASSADALISGSTPVNQTPNAPNLSNATIISDDDGRNKKYVNKASNSEEGNSDDAAWLAEKDRILKLYAHKLHLRKPRMQDPSLCSHEIEFLSDFDDDDY